jgi:class 3 adenylate cyclase
MKLWKRLIQARRRLSIITKFVLAFVALLLLIGAVAFTGFFSLNVVGRETKQAIVTSIDMQRQVFAMDAALRNARRLERDFFLRWPAGFSSSELQDYRQQHRREIEKTIAISSELQELLTSANVSAALRRSNPVVVDYVEIVEEYSRRFNETVGLVGNLGIDDVGSLAQLEQNAANLYDRFQLADAPELMAQFREIQSLEQDYLSTREPPKMEAVYRAVEELRDRIQFSDKLDEAQQAETLRYLNGYVSAAREIVQLDQEILEIISNFDQQVEDVSEQLITLAESEVRRGTDSINFTSRVAVILLIAAVLVSFILAGAVAKQFASALRTLAQEQRTSERLLLNILPKPIAQRLKREETTIADSFAEVTVLFADIVGFTELAAQTPPIVLVEILNEIFSDFDELVEEHGLEKIKTIGDAYMVVGGLPVPMANHAEAVAAMALDMQARITEFSMSTGTALSIRIGINTGPVIAGIIGRKKFIYDLWGDTVNIASRMESHGLPGCIQVTEETYKHLRGKFRFEERRSVKVKGKGWMNCYLLTSQKNLPLRY